MKTNYEVLNKEWLQANNNWMKANAMLQNLITLVSEEDETVDVISSLDVINDYMESIRTNLDVIENYI